jgi:uridine kinase
MTAPLTNRNNVPVVVGVAGGTGAGKTTISHAILDYDAMEDSLLLHHLHQLLRLEPTEIPVYDFRTYTRSPQTIHQEPRPVILLEGILLFANPDLRALMDIKIYVDTDADLRFIRRLERDVQERGRSVASVVEQYLRTVRPMHLEFVEPSKRYADVIVPATTHNPVALEMICARIEAVLSRTPGSGHFSRGVVS